MDSGFWEDRKVLITGHTGFKGSWLCLWLEKLGANVVGYALDPPTTPNLFELAEITQRVESLHGDVRDSNRLSTVVRDYAPQVIFHLAAQSVVRDAYSDPIETYSTNVLGAACLFQAARRASGRLTIVNVTTDKCYKNREWLWGYRENDELGGHDPYSSSKACAELVTQSFRDSFFPLSELDRHGTAVATARAGNVIGGGDWTHDQLIPDIVRAFDAGEPVLIRRPDAIRPWQHVMDCLSGYVLLAEKLTSNPREFSGGWNFGPALGDTRPVAWIADYLAGAWGNDAAWRLDRSAHPHESGTLRLDSSKAAQILGWRPRLTLPRALDWTAEWYKEHGAGANARELCLQQIEQYMRLAQSENDPQHRSSQISRQ